MKTHNAYLQRNTFLYLDRHLFCVLVRKVMITSCFWNVACNVLSIWVWFDNIMFLFFSVLLKEPLGFQPHIRDSLSFFYFIWRHDRNASTSSFHRPDSQRPEREPCDQITESHHICAYNWEIKYIDLISTFRLYIACEFGDCGNLKS